MTKYEAKKRLQTIMNQNIIKCQAAIKALETKKGAKK